MIIEQGGILPRLFSSLSAPAVAVTSLSTLPVDSRPIDRYHFLVDAAPAAVIMHGLAASLNGSIIVNDKEAAFRQLRVQVDQRIRGRFVHVPVQANDRQS